MPIRIKICGVTNEEDAALAAQLGADAVGLNFHSASLRFVSFDTATSILRALPPLVEPVGVFVERTWPEMLDVVGRVPGLACLQRHGAPLMQTPPVSVRFVPAFGVQDESTLCEILRYLDQWRAQAWLPSAILVDAQVPGQHGGTGKQAPWNLLADFHPGIPLVLAGGLTPDNIVEAVRIVHPYAVDVASGIERQPGRKDLEKMKRFIGQAREAAARYP